MSIFAASILIFLSVMLYAMAVHRVEERLWMMISFIFIGMAISFVFESLVISTLKYLKNKRKLKDKPK